MKIRRISEDLDLILSNDRTQEVIKDLKMIKKSLDKRNDIIKSTVSSLDSYTNKKSSKNTQIDDSVVLLNSLSPKIEEIKSIIDNIISNLDNYNKNGEDFLY
jgi:uncharacterized coiled-coil DUF342 family protein